MDSNPLERSAEYDPGPRILRFAGAGHENQIVTRRGTPISARVERILRMVDWLPAPVDAAEGPCPQTRSSRGRHWRSD